MASTAWERRNARARALGFESYYDYRAHNYGRTLPGTPRATGDELARLRGHRGGADLDRLLERGDVELVNVIQTGKDPPEFELLITRADGSTKTYTLRGRADVERFRKRIDQLGPAAPKIVGSPDGRNALMKGSDFDSFEAEAEQRAQEEAEGELEPDEPAAGDDGIPF